jgi:hypothetical protein
MADDQLRRCIFVLGLVLIAAAGVPSAGAQGLSGAESAAINNLLGVGVLGVALPASPITDPASLIPLTPATWSFQFASGPNQGTTETDVLQANTQAGADSQWQYTAGQSTIYDLGTAVDGSIVSASEQDLSQGVLTRYAPPRPVLLPGMQPGAQQTVMLQVNVYNIGDPSTVTHTGSLTLTVTYVGRYQVTVPAGTYPAALIKWQYNGQVGPATVSDVEYRFFADGIGPVAVIDKQNVSAFLIYSSNTKYGKVLSAKSG